MTKPAKILVAADVPGAKPDSETNHQVGPPPLDCETHRLVPKHKEKAFPSVSAVHLEKGSTVVVIALVDAP